MKKRVLSLALALALCLALVPLTALAAAPTIASASSTHSAALISTSYYIPPYISDNGLISISEGFINNEAKLVIPKNYDSAQNFSDGLAAVQKNGKWGYINTAGTLVIPYQFDSAARFYGGVAVMTEGSYPNWRYSVIDKRGNVIIPEGTYDRIMNADGTGLIPVGKDDGNGAYKWGFADTTGKLVIAPQYQNIYYNTENTSGLLAVAKGENWGFIDKSGAVKIPFEYEGLVAFNEFGYTMVYRSSGWGIIDSSNNVIVPLEHSPIPGTGYPFSFLSQNLVQVHAFDEELSYVIDLRTGARATDLDRFSVIYPFVDGYTLAYLNGAQCIIDESGSVIISSDTLKKSSLLIAGEYGAGGAQQSGNFGDGHFVVLFADSSSNTYRHYIIKITKDTPSGWAEESVRAAIAAGLVPEALQSKYTTATTRAEFCALAVALYETVTGTEITGRATFSDTSDVNVEKMAFLGVVSGVGSNKFAPDRALTREQAATMLAQLSSAIGKPLTAQSPTFADSAVISSWAINGVGQVQSAGIMSGTNNNNFSPRSQYTREQSISTIVRLYESLK